MLLELVLMSIAFFTSYKAFVVSKNKAKVQGYIMLRFYMLISIV
jgi:hypothetical protein